MFGFLSISLSLYIKNTVYLFVSLYIHLYTCSVIVEYKKRNQYMIAGLSMFTCLVYFVKLTFNSCLFALIRKVKFFWGYFITLYFCYFRMKINDDEDMYTKVLIRILNMLFNYYILRDFSYTTISNFPKYFDKKLSKLNSCELPQILFSLKGFYCSYIKSC